MRFPPDFIERVAEANNIVDIISQYTQLKPTGGGLMGRCPFPDHPEKTPSFSVSEMKQVYHCFGCHKKGNIFTFLQFYNGMSFPEAIEYLANRAHIAMPEVASQDQQKQDFVAKKKKQIAAVNKHAAEFFRNQFKKLPSDHPAKVYATNRGLTGEILETFQIGYSSEEWDSLVKYFESKAIPLPLVEEAKLIKARSGGKTGYFDLFRERLMFPIHSTMGEPIAFGGRILEKGEPKYLNSPETPVFHKGKVLYGLAQTAKFIRSEDQAIIVEGYMDLISLYKAGITNVVATMGTALTPDHGKMLSRITKNIVVLFDGDSAGQTAAERSLPILLSAGLHPRGLVLPDNQDPDDFVSKNGQDALRALIAQSTDLFAMILSMWMKEYRGEAAQKVNLCDQLEPIFASIQDSRLRQLYLKDAAEKMRVEERWLYQAVTKSPSKNMPTRDPRVMPSSPTSKVVPETQVLHSELTVSDENRIILKGATKAEGLLMALALKSREHFEQFLQSNILEVVRHTGVKKVLERAASTYGQAPEKFDKLTGLLASFVDRPELLFAPQDVVQTESSDDGVGDWQSETGLTDRENKLLQDCLRRVRDEALKAESDELARELKISPDPEKMQRFLQLQKERLKKTPKEV